ncbi:MAG: porin, partial [Gammaproteobacteria bacterium]|nr:porin [Gammaproteobacteria bacterium]
MKTLNKNILSVSVAAALLAGTSIVNADTTVSGFVDVIYTVTNDGQAATPPAVNGAENKFLADGEIDIVSTVKGATVRLDLDVRIAALAGGDNTGGAEVEQAHIAVPIGGVTLIAGVFNNPIGYEAEDAPDLDFTSHNIIYDILNDQTALHGNNLAGAALAGAIGPVTLTGAFINDLGHVSEENSVALIANITVASNLDLELGYVTQDDAAGAGAAGSAGDVLDFNAVWSNSQFAVGIDYMNFGQLLDDAMVVWGGINVGPVNLKVRFETVAAAAAGSADAEQTTFYASYPLAANSTVALEIKDGDVT